MEEGRFPSDKSSLEEQRRLFFVAMTRAKLKDAAREEPAAQTQQETKQQQKKSASSSQERELTPKEKEEIARLAAEKMQRDEEIRASALTASGGSFKLITDTQAVSTAGSRITKSGGNKMIDDLQSQIKTSIRK